MKLHRIFWGEFFGTFLLVFFGCGSVAAAVLTGAQVGIFQVAIVWGIGIALAIHLTGGISGAHLNPAITLALTFWKKKPASDLFPYLLGQFLGAFAAAGVLFLLFSSPLAAFEAREGIVRGSQESVASAMIFGEFYPNPAGKPLSLSPFSISILQAFLIEVIGTAILSFTIFGLTDQNNKSKPHEATPLLIGLTVTLLISLLGPLTMACFNPARDLAPRLFSSLAGWGSVPFTANGNGWWVVYLIAPVIGALAGGGLYEKVISPFWKDPEMNSEK
jgi:glycerol uptake facilitator protein